MTKKDIAIFGGTFDPVHIGHIEIIKYFVDNFLADEVWVLPSYYSPHKSSNTIDTFDDRVNMLNIALKNINGVYVNTFEKEYYLNNNSKTYTYNILKELSKKYLNVRFHFVVGFDSMKNIETWYKYKELLSEYWFYIFDRSDDDFTSTEQKKIYLNSINKKLNNKFYYEFFNVSITDISSSYLRNLLTDFNKNKEELLKYIDKDVLSYIGEKKLYEF